jgi:hypothetical protein
LSRAVEELEINYIEGVDNQAHKLSNLAWNVKVSAQLRLPFELLQASKKEKENILVRNVCQLW